MTAVHVIRLRYSNAYLLVGERPVLVDTGSRGDARGLHAACVAVGIAPRDLSLILHTHVHSDHFGNTAELSADAGCPVAYHPADRHLAEQGHNGLLRGVGLRGRLMARMLSNLAFRPRPADVDAVEGWRLADFGIAATVLHTPGHTAGSISLLLDDGDAIVGDMLMGGRAGGMIRPGRPNFHYFADDLPLAMAGLDRIIAATDGRLFVGHGGPLVHRDVVTWRHSWRDRPLPGT